MWILRSAGRHSGKDSDEKDRQTCSYTDEQIIQKYITFEKRWREREGGVYD